MKLSIIMMVKNEEKYLDKALLALKEIRDHIKTELIIVDTGSEDHTVEIAKRYTDKVYFHQWNNDFGSMRNQTIKYATGEWLLVLDGDEVFQDTHPLIQFLKSGNSKRYNAGVITIKSITEEGMEDSSGKVDMLRLFKNTKQFHYKGVIHEQPQYHGPIFYTGATVLHYGYLATDKNLMELKFERNKRLLEKELEKDPENSYYWFQLSQTYGMHKDYKEALEANLKAYESAKNQKVNFKDYMYIYTHMAHCYYLNKKYVELEQICLEALEIEEGHIDLYYYLGKAQKFLNKNKKSIDSYKKYLIFLDKHNKNDLLTGASLTKTSLELYEDVYLDLSIGYNRLNNSEEALQYARKIKKEYMYRFLMPQLIELYIDLGKYEELQKEYTEVKGNKEHLLRDFWITVEKTMVKLDKEQKHRIMKFFSIGDCNYAFLNKIRLSIEKSNGDIDFNQIMVAKQLDFTSLPVFFGDIIYALIKNKIIVGDVLHNVRENVIQLYIEFLLQKYESFSHDIVVYIQKVNEKLNLDEIRFQKVCMRNLLLLDKLDADEFLLIWDRYIESGIYYISQIYNTNIVENEMVYDVKNEEDAFLLYMLLAKRNEYVNVTEYVRYIRQALKTYPYMKKGIEILLHRVKKIEEDKSKEIAAPENQQLEQYKTQIKNKIREFINSGETESALGIIRQYEEMISNDIEIYSMKAVVLMMQGDMEEARKVLLIGLEVQPNHSDLLYNLKYFYETIGEQEKAEKIIIPVEKTAKDELEEYKKSVKNKIESLIEQEFLEEVEQVITEYEKIIKDDPDIYAIRGVIALMQGDIGKAENILKAGLEVEPSHCNLLYNIAYLYETQGNDVMAYKYYKELSVIADEELAQEVRNKIKGLQGKNI